MDEDGHKRSYYALEKDDETAPHVKMLFDKFIEFGSVSKLENYLLKNHITSIQGKEYSKAVLRQLLSNPAYAANDKAMFQYLYTAGCDLANACEEYDGQHSLIGYGKTKTLNSKITKRARADKSSWIIAVSQHQAIVSGEQWVTVQKKIEANAQKYPRLGTSNISLLSGIIRCGKCGAPMHVKGNVSRANGTTAFTYKCGRKDRSSGVLCDIPNVSGVSLDNMVVSVLKDLFSDQGKITETVTEMRKKMHTDQSSREKDMRMLQVKIAGNEERMTNLALKLADSKSSDLDGPIYAALQRLKDETDTFKIQLDALTQQDSDGLMEKYNLDSVQEEMKTFCDTFDQKDTEAKRDSIRTIVKQITWHGDDFDIELFGGIVEKKRRP